MFSALLDTCFLFTVRGCIVHVRYVTAASCNISLFKPRCIAGLQKVRIAIKEIR